jgi:peptide/nickel transport system substrate-binding protein
MKGLMFVKTTRTVSIAAAAVLSLTALSMGLGSAGGLNAASASASGGTFIEPETAVWTSDFIPALSDSGTNVPIYGNQFYSLLGTTPAGLVTTYGGLASKYTVSKNHKTFTFWLNPKARGSDGRRVTARDAQLYLEWIASKAYVDTLAGPYSGSLDDIVGMTEKNGDPLPNGQSPAGYKQLGKYEFSITITAPYANALINEVSGITPLPYFILHKYPMQDWAKIPFNHMPTVGDGPWVMSKVIPSEVILQTANKYFEYGPPRISTYEWKYVPSSEEAGDLIKGVVNYVGSINPKYYAQIKNVPGIKVQVVHGVTYGYIGWRFNNAKYGKIFDNVHFRRGVMYALNRPELNQAYSRGLGAVETGPLPDVYSWYDRAANTGKYAYAYSPAKAMKEFEEAGLVYNKQTGWFDTANGKTFKPTLTYYSGVTSAAEESTSIAEFMHAAHLDLILNPPMNFNSMLAELQNDKDGTQPIQGFLIGLGFGVDPSFYSIIGSQAGFNLSQWDITNQTLPNFQPEDMKLLEEQRSGKAFNYAYRKKIIDEWQMLFSKYLPYEILNSPYEVDAYSTTIHGLVVNAFGFFHPWTWYISS